MEKRTVIITVTAAEKKIDNRRTIRRRYAKSGRREKKRKIR
jgi:hypothetical protein